MIFGDIISRMNMIEKPTEYLEDEPDYDAEKEEPVESLPYTPDSPDEGIRKSGLAYSAGIALFGAVAVMVLAGLGIDAYFGSAPLGLVGGVFIGAGLGFYQFFRITSQIIGKK